MKKTIYLLILLISFGCQPQPTEKSINKRQTIADEIENSLKTEILEVWYPRVVDTLNGGYTSDYDYQWKKKGPQDKMIVTQARHIWTAAKAAEFYPENPVYVEVAKHGFPFLRDKMWDQEYGGYYTLVNAQGEVVAEGDRIIKTAYGNAFAIYGLAALYKLTRDSDVLKQAIQSFQWLDKNSHDPQFKGYFQFMERDGTAIEEGWNDTPPKDQNSSIHLLEAFTELYQVWPDDTLRSRLEEMLILIRDVIVIPPGYLTLFSQKDWTPVSYRDSSEEAREANHYHDHVSFGHDIETAYLLMEASEALGIHNDEKTLTKAKQMADHALEKGFDESVGGLYDAGYYFKDQEGIAIIRDSKNWWAQSETLNTLLIMADLYDDPTYFSRFEKQWKYIKDNLIDHENGGWYAGGIDKEPDRKTGNKSGIWKGAYHTARALMNVSQRLSGEE